MSRRLEAEQWIAAPLPRVFAFFADPHNLPRTMPPSRGARLLRLSLIRQCLPASQTPPDAERMAGVCTRDSPSPPIHLWSCSSISRRCGFFS